MKAYFELGVKLATSRWRELARAGELSEGAIDRLRKLLGYTARREAEGLNRGSLNMLRQMGLGLESGKAVPRREAAFMEQMGEAPFGVYDLSPEGIRTLMGSSAIPGRGVIHDPSLRKMKVMLQRADPSVSLAGQREASSATLRHEVDELRAMRHLGIPIGHKPTTTQEAREQGARMAFKDVGPELRRKVLSAKTSDELAKILPGQLQSIRFMHAHPSVVLNELRNLRMMPKARPWFAPLRSNEYAALSEHFGKPIEQLRVGPRTLAMGDPLGKEYQAQQRELSEHIGRLYNQ